MRPLRQAQDRQSRKTQLRTSNVQRRTSHLNAHLLAPLNATLTRLRLTALLTAHLLAPLNATLTRLRLTALLTATLYLLLSVVPVFNRRVLPIQSGATIPPRITKNPHCTNTHHYYILLLSIGVSDIPAEIKPAEPDPVHTGEKEMEYCKNKLFHNRIAFFYEGIQIMNTDGMERRNAVLTIAGSDSGGNAGIQADLRAFHTFGVHGCTVITALTAQNPFEVTGVLTADASFVTQQIDAVIETYDIKALKIGMLCNTAIIEAVADVLISHSRILKVIDPVMIATSGAKLLEDDAIEALQRKLLPRADLITPNLPEAEVLLNRKLSNDDDIVAGANELSTKFGCCVLIKGGHANTATARDLLKTAENTLWLESPYVKDPISTHGTGCSLSAAITAALACGKDLIEAVIEGKAYVYEAIRTAVNIGEYASVLGTPKSLPVNTIKTFHL